MSITVTVDREFKALIPPLSDDEFAGLEASIIEEGRARVPLDVWNGVLIDGQNRFTICKRHMLPFTVQEVGRPDWTRTDALIWIIQNQFNRRNLSLFARAELALKLKPLIEEKAKENQRRSEGDDRKSEGARNQGCLNSDNLDPTPPVAIEPANDQGLPAPAEQAVTVAPAKPKPAIEPVNTLKEIAKAAGVGRDTIHKAEVIAAKADEETKERLRRGETTINREYKAIVGTERKEQQVEAVKSTLLPTGKFTVIVADPPWSYGARAEDVTHRAANPYPSMTIKEICAMPVAGLAADDCILWLWTTNAHMRESYQVAEAWPNLDSGW